jgi:DNA-binding SARP family transcriptional activator
LWVDLEGSEDLISSADVGDMYQALKLHRGELLADDRYVEWAALRREAVRQRYHAVLVALRSGVRAGW